MLSRNGVLWFIILGGMVVTATSIWRVANSGTTQDSDEFGSPSSQVTSEAEIEIEVEPTAVRAPRADSNDWISAIDRAAESGDFEEAKRLEVAAWEDRLKKHEVEPVDESFRARVEADLEEKMRSTSFEGVRFDGITCKSSTCRGNFSFDSFDIASQRWKQVMRDGRFGYGQLRVSMTLPEPADTTVPYEASVLLDFSNVVF